MMDIPKKVKTDPQTPRIIMKVIFNENKPSK
jgi:hypothetical protein